MHKPFILEAQGNAAITIEVTPGHFATSSSHVTHYLDMNALKTDVLLARETAKELAATYLTTDLVDTILCLENTEIIGAFLGQELHEEGTLVMNNGCDVSVITPMNNVNGQLIFQQSEIRHIKDQNVILLMASVSSGKTVLRALECLRYYGGKLVGISAIFSAIPTAYDHKIHSVFSSDDIVGYRYTSPAKCELCQEKVKLDALVNCGGYTEL